MIELHALASQRSPQLAWPLARLAAILDDFPEVAWRMVAGRCLDYIAERQGVRDGPRTLRTFMEREQRSLDERRRERQLAATKADVFVRCPICGERFNISAETRRPDRDLVSVCAACYARTPEEEPDGSTDQEPRTQGPKLRAV